MVFAYRENEKGRETMLKLKVLLADSDPENIKNFRTYIRLAFPDIKVVAGLNSALDFRERVREHMPNLILADIRFFGALSYQTIREVSEFFPDIRFIIYGSYNDAEYIQRVMEFGVIDYIYRPVKPTDLERCLRRANDVFSAIENKKLTQETLVKKYKANIPMFRDRFLANLINGNLTSEFEINSSIAYFNLNLSPDYMAMIVKIDHFKKIALTLEEQEKHLLVFKIATIINEKLKNLNNGVSFINNLNELVIILGKSISLEDSIALGDEIKTETVRVTNQEVTIGMGRKYTSPTDICVSYREAEAALRYRSYIGYNTVIPIHYVEPMNNITYRYPVLKESYLVYSAVIGEYDYCVSLLDQLFSALEKSGGLPDNLVSKIVMNIVISINRYASEQNILMGNQFMHYFPTKDIIEIKTIDEARKYLAECLKKFCDHVLELRNDNKNEVVNLAVEYINENYNKDITIFDIALRANTTPEFLSNAFYEKRNKRIHEYIAELKIAHAKKLIRETDETDEIISVQVGYKDIRRFKKDFKKYEGIQVHEYRAKEKA